jgi:hypothetical protein
VDAQAGTQFVGLGTVTSINGTFPLAITGNGDLYTRWGAPNCADGGPIDTESKTWSGVKENYRK